MSRVRIRQLQQLFPTRFDVKPWGLRAALMVAMTAYVRIGELYEERRKYASAQ
jgi:hypothetical protein